MSYSLRGLALLLFVALSACGGGGGAVGSTPAANRAPTANFAFSCADLVCTFTSNSTDQDVGDAVVSHSWTFGDGTPRPATDPAPVAHLRRRRRLRRQPGRRRSASATGTLARQVTVTAPPAPAAPHANFTASCISLDCTFTDTTTFDAGSAFQSRCGTSATARRCRRRPADPSYAATTLTTFTAKLTVTDTAGKTSTSVQSVVVAPPATTLSLRERQLHPHADAGVAGIGRAAQPFVRGAQGNRVVITAPITQVDLPRRLLRPRRHRRSRSTAAPRSPRTRSCSSPSVRHRGRVEPGFQPAIRVTGDFATAGR